jgi:hypothetical protein
MLMEQSLILANFIGWSGNFGFFMGAILCAKKNTLGWYSQIIANMLYVIQSIMLNNSSLLWLSIILIFVNIYGIYKWSKK